MDAINSLLVEVEQEADQLSVEILFRLVEKLENLPRYSVTDNLRYYVSIT